MAGVGPCGRGDADGCVRLHHRQRRRARGGPRLGHAELIDGLLALRDPADRWHVRRADSDDGADLVAEWTMVDAEWRRMFGEAGEHKVLRVLMRLNDERATVRSLDREAIAT